MSTFRSSERLSLAAFLFVSAVVMSAYPSLTQALATSIATNNSSEWLSTDSGWVTQRQSHGVAPPFGSWRYGYKHWFQPPTLGEPRFYTNFGSDTKPPAATWDAKAFGTYTKRTTSGASFDESRWYVKPYTSFTYFGLTAPEYYTKFQTYSEANASAPVTIAGAKTDIRDPVTLFNPGAGNWSIRDDFAMFGDVDAQSNDSLIEYDIGLALSPGLDPTTVLSIIIGGRSATLTVNDLFFDGIGGHLLFADANGNVEDVTTLQNMLNSHYDGTGWHLDPSTFDISTFRPDSMSDLAQVFSIQIFMQIPSTYSSVTVDTDRFSLAVASVPEPSTLTLLGVAMAGLSFARRRKLF